MYRPVILLCLLFVSVHYSLNAHPIDTLIAQLSGSKNDTNKVLLLNKIAFEFSYVEPAKGITYAENALELSDKLNYQKGMADSYVAIGSLFSLKGDFGQAELYLDKAKMIFYKIKNVVGMANVLSAKGGIYQKRSQFDKALNCKLQALLQYQKAKHRQGETISLSNIATIYARLKKYGEAENYYNKAIGLKKELGDESGLSISYSNLGAMYYDRELWDKALNAFKKALVIQEKLQEPQIIIICKSNIANILLYANKLGEAYILQSECFTIYKTYGDTAAMARTLVSMGVIDQMKKNYKEAIKKYEESVVLCNTIEDKESLKAAYTGLYECYIALGDHKTATGLVEKIVKLSEDLFNRDLAYGISNAAEKYEAEKKDNNIKLLEKENGLLNEKAEKRKLYIAFSLGGGILLVILILIITGYRRKQQQAEQAKDKAVFELQALMAQMNPHFIFNALNSIQHFILEKGKQEAYDYLAKFSKLVRMVLNNSEDKMVSLQKELELIGLYIELEQLRFANGFGYQLTVSENINPENIELPTMLIQPYVENAIWQGLMNLNNERVGYLEINIEKDNDKLRIIIQDNGIGRRLAKQFRKDEIHGSKGMKISERRLQMINAMKGYENASVTIIDLPGDSGTKVEIILPV